MGYQRVQIGSVATLIAVLSDGEDDLFVRATVRDSEGDEITDSPFDVPNVEGGLYQSNEFVPAEPGRYSAYFEAFTDAGYTVPAGYPIVADLIDVEVPLEFGADVVKGQVGSNEGFLVGIVSDNL